MKLADKDLALVRDYLIKNCSVSVLEKAGLLDRPPDRRVRTQLAELDLEFFNRFYLSQHFSRPPAPIHHEVHERITRVLRTPGRVGAVFVLPRGFGKTTILTLGVPLWSICYERQHHIPIISDSFDQAKDQLSTLKHELEHNERILEDFGELRGRVWQEAEAETANQIKVVALGARMKIRGRKYGRHRPDLIVVDDIENIKSVQSATQRGDMLTWFTRDVMRAGWEDTKVIAVGNFLHHDCLLAHLVANPMFEHYVTRALLSWPTNMRLWDRWHRIITNLADPEKDQHALEFFLRHRAEMLEGAVSAWPEAFPVYDLMLMRVSEGEASFSMELQNEPTDPSKRLFKRWGLYRREFRDGEVWLAPLSGRPAVRLRDCAIFGFTDPSLGKTISSDYSALIIVAKAPTRQQFTLEADIKRRPPEQIMADQITWARQYPITRWGIEKNQFQALYATESARRSQEEAVYLPVMPINQLGNKTLRIQSLEPDLENEYILLSEHGQELLKEQLRQWPMSAYDDGPDALEGVRNLAREWEPLTATEVVQSDTHEFGKAAQPIPGHAPLSEDPYAQYEPAGLFVPTMYA